MNNAARRLFGIRLVALTGRRRGCASLSRRSGDRAHARASTHHAIAAGVAKVQK
jgi:hypothetical protein